MFFDSQAAFNPCSAFCDVQHSDRTVRPSTHSTHRRLRAILGDVKGPGFNENAYRSIWRVLATPPSMLATGDSEPTGFDRSHAKAAELMSSRHTHPTLNLNSTGFNEHAFTNTQAPLALPLLSSHHRYIDALLKDSTTARTVWPSAELRTLQLQNHHEDLEG